MGEASLRDREAVRRRAPCWTNAVPGGRLGACHRYIDSRLAGARQVIWGSSIAWTLASRAGQFPGSRASARYSRSKGLCRST